MNSTSDPTRFPAETKLLYFGLGWEYVPENPFDLNLFAVGVDENNRFVAPDALCYFGDRVTLNGSLRISPDNRSGKSSRSQQVDEYLLLDTRHLPARTSYVHIGVQIFKAKTRFQNFTGLEEAFLRIKDAENGTLFATVDLDQTIQQAIGAIVGRVVVSAEGFSFEPRPEPLFGDTIWDSLQLLNIKPPIRKKIFGLF